MVILNGETLLSGCTVSTFAACSYFLYRYFFIYFFDITGIYIDLTIATRDIQLIFEESLKSFHDVSCHITWQNQGTRLGPSESRASATCVKPLIGRKHRETELNRSMGVINFPPFLMMSKPFSSQFSWVSRVDHNFLFTRPPRA